MPNGSRRPPVAALVYGLLLLAMGAGQLSDPGGFADILVTYDAFTGAEGVVAALVIAAEAVAGVGLPACRRLPDGAARSAAWIGLGVAVFWSALAIQAFARGLDVPNCGCFGVHLGQPLRWWVLPQDAYMLVLAWFAAIGAGIALPRPRRRITA